MKIRRIRWVFDKGYWNFLWSFVPTGIAKYHHHCRLEGHIWLKNMSRKLRTAAILVNIFPAGRLVTNKYIALTYFEFRSRSHNNSTNLIFLTTFSSFRTNHFPYTTIFTSERWLPSGYEVIGAWKKIFMAPSRVHFIGHLVPITKNRYKSIRTRTNGLILKPSTKDRSIDIQCKGHSFL